MGFGNCLEGVWRVSVGCLNGVLRASGRCQEAVSRVSGWYLFDVFMVIWKIWTGIKRVSAGPSLFKPL